MSPARLGEHRGGDSAAGARTACPSESQSPAKTRGELPAPRPHQSPRAECQSRES